MNGETVISHQSLVRMYQIDSAGLLMSLYTFSLINGEKLQSHHSMVRSYSLTGENLVPILDSHQGVQFSPFIDENKHFLTDSCENGKRISPIARKRHFLALVSQYFPIVE